MTVSEKDLFMAILSMDSYHRGYDPGIGGLGGIGTAIGSATLFLESDVTENSAGVAAGFYAASYETQWGTVISYRGTTFNGAPAINDVLHGWAFVHGDFAATSERAPTLF